MLVETRQNEFCRVNAQLSFLGPLFFQIPSSPFLRSLTHALTLDVPPLGDDAEDLVGAVLVLVVLVEALPGAVVEEAEPARQEERVGPGLAAAAQPLALRRHGQVRPRGQQRRRRRRAAHHALARAAVVLDLEGRKQRF